MAKQLVIALLSMLLWTPAQARKWQPVEFVDLELILAVDVSRSMNARRLQLQREGYVAAFRDPEVIRAIKSGPQGRVAVTYVEWSGSDSQTTIVPWRVIGSADDANAFANDLEQSPTSRTRRTSISAMLNKAQNIFESSGVRALRRVVDVSGDGPNNSGPPVVKARNDLIRTGVVINGLPILSEPDEGPGYMVKVDLDDYYRDCVIGGPGSFYIPVSSMQNFAKAIRMKLIREIAAAPKSAMPGVPRQVDYQPAAASPLGRRVTCSIAQD
ncbi:MAG: DUF1194 domain-containing protein [Hyphomicrobiaceae bacterium]